MSVDPSCRTTLRADYLFQGGDRVLRDAFLAVEADRIVECRVADGPSADIDLHNVAIIPPLVNAHTHLEFSCLDEPISAGAHFGDWIEAVICQRAADRKRDPSSVAAIRRGLDQTRRYGCLQIGEIATTVDSHGADQQHTVGGVQFLELLGAAPIRVASQLAIAQQFLQSRLPAPHYGFRAGLSPHAPYSAAMELVEGAVSLARQYHVPVAMHLAETQAEMQLLARGDGPLADLLIERKIWPPPHITAQTCAMDYLEVLAKAPRALVIHGNYLTASQRSFVANRPQMSIVYCPRTHAYFGHPQYPLAETIAAGARVALGTDSCASNPDLSIWAEAQFVARNHADVPPATVLELVTGAARVAMGEAPQTVEPGQPASFAVIAGLPPGSTSDQDPFSMLLASGTYPAGAWLRGREIPLD